MLDVGLRNPKSMRIIKSLLCQAVTGIKRYMSAAVAAKIIKYSTPAVKRQGLFIDLIFQFHLLCRHRRRRRRRFGSVGKYLRHFSTFIAKFRLFLERKKYAYDLGTRRQFANGIMKILRI